MKRLIACGAAVIGTVVSAAAAVAPNHSGEVRDLVSHLRFLADFDSPVQMGGELYPDPLKEGWEVEGKFGKGYFFHSERVNGERRPRQNVICTSDRELTRHFPTAEGSFSLWFRIDPTHPYVPRERFPCGLWSFARRNKTDWSLVPRFFTTCASSNWRDFVNPGYYSRLYAPSNVWQHAVCAWKGRYGAFYLDGRLVAEKKDAFLEPMTNAVEATFRLGSSGNDACELALDEAALFDVCLTPDEVKALATAKRGLMEGRRRPLVKPLEFHAFARNETNVVLRFEVWTPGKGMETVERRFDASRHRPGKVQFEWTHAGARHVTELTVLPTRDRGCFKVNCWDGGSDYDFKRLMGCNQVNAHSAQTRTGRLAFRDLANGGFFVTMRHWNANDWREAAFDWTKVEAKAERDLSFAAGLEAWTSTLLSTETYGASPCIRAQSNATWTAEAKAAIGMEPDFRFKYGPDQLDWRSKMGLKRAPAGVIGPTNAAMETLRWVTETGNPFYGVNRASTRAVRRLSPGNVTWTEPVIPPVGPAAGMARSVDAMGEWNYCYGVSTTIAEFCASWGLLRPLGTLHMPTLTCAYWHGGPPVKGNPRRPGAKLRNGKPEPFKIAQSADEVMVKAMCALGATPIHALGFFGTWDWRQGGPNGAAYLAGSTNQFDVVGDPGAAEKFGAFMRRTFLPAADLLAGLGNAPARVAYLLPRELYHSGNYGWEIYKCKSRVGEILADLGLPFDVLYDAELTPETLSRYRVALLPQAACLTEEHVAACRAAAERGTVFVTGDDACVDFPNGERIKGFRYYSPKSAQTLRPLRDTLTARREALRQALTALSEGDGTTVRTFEKTLDGVRYVMVVNDNRRPNAAADGLLTTIATNDWYRPYGAPQRIVTTVRGVPKGAAVYEFNKGARDFKDGRDGKDVTITRDFDAAEGVVYCVCPEPLKKPELSVSSLASSVLNLGVTIATASGNPAPGRSVVALTVKDPDGRVTDESGRYVVESGRREVAVRFADADPKDGTWTVTARDLVTGKTSAISFKR